MSDKPELLKGGLSADDRGRVYFVNELDLSGFRRMYFVENFSVGTVRAWHAHRHERKWVMAVNGAALACCVEIDDWDSPSPDAAVHRFVLDASTPSVLAVPAGYANGAMSLSPGTKLLYCSDASLDSSLGDDIRFPARHWDPWHVAER
ncbi:MAG TPA: dTDP-4-dehydrorhamnose 3,5-epimerase family protein [Acidimicrobiales bacterium]|nr:dTDP-4-dehydrorhamnose 3,5-epimerase family protein [Acidimicrobiales bacterium]